MDGGGGGGVAMALRGGGRRPRRVIKLAHASLSEAENHSDPNGSSCHLPAPPGRSETKLFHTFPPVPPDAAIRLPGPTIHNNLNQTPPPPFSSFQLPLHFLSIPPPPTMSLSARPYVFLRSVRRTSTILFIPSLSHLNPCPFGPVFSGAPCTLTSPV